MRRVVLDGLLCIRRLSVGHKEIAELLIAAGADVNANYHGNTVLCNVTINLTGFYEMF
jgi:ankyrin repeat protein